MKDSFKKFHRSNKNFSQTYIDFTKTRQKKYIPKFHSLKDLNVSLVNSVIYTEDKQEIP